MALIVPFGLFHISLRSYSFTLAALGVIVAHLTATPYLSVAFADSAVTSSSVSLRYLSPKS